ncbi:MAG TPA: serine/threonine-protein kinase [Vicinamibacterales bacterium]
MQPPDEETRLADGLATARVATTTPASRGDKAASSSSGSSGFTTTAPDIDHGRFPPGSLLDQRYRIVGRLGKGGMGEVYRADDLRLGQPVALKFLPEDVDRDPARLTQLHTEVRMARQVSHANVCRVYDVGEFEGHTFLSMEYVDGEDLASLLRRIGRFPQDRAIELTRQICAGLAAAHERGVVHRDLKPANIMLDGGGRIRITDFGLAGTSGEVLRAGTPAYMAPEQLAGGEVTPRSDIYALGLVLYEMFTGRRALEAANLAELIVKREQAAIVPPTDVVRDLDEQIERVIMRCLQPDPARRPGSALAVSAALPGGDPLAAALAAGETPSPDMVAAADTSAVLTPALTWAGVGWIVASLAIIVAFYQHVLMVNVVDPPKPPAVLIDRAQDVVQRLGYGTAAASSGAGVTLDLDWARFVGSSTTGADRWQRLHTARPESVLLWYRTGPRTLVPYGSENGLQSDNPPLTTAGMTLVVIDDMGRLAEFVAVPDPKVVAAAPFTNWQALFELAGLSMSGFTPAAPAWVPMVHAEQRVAWEGHIPEVPDQTVRIEAGATGGKPVFFAVAAPWSRSTRTPPSEAPAPPFLRVVRAIASLTMPALMVVGAVLARRNLKLGRGDRRGAFRAAAAVFFLQMAAWLLGSSHVLSFDPELNRFFSAVGQGLFGAAVLWLTYLGLEPYVRRFSPDSLVGWQRLVGGGWRDARVGRDVLIGVAAGLAMTVVFAVHNKIPPLFGRPEPMPVFSDLSPLMGVRFSIAIVLSQMENAVSSGMLATAGYVVFRILLKRRVPAVAAAILCFVWVVLQGLFNPGWPALDLLCGLVITATFVITLDRVGLLATIATLATHFLLLRAPLTTDWSTWRASAGMANLGAVLLLGLSAAYLASRQHARVIRT